MAAAALSHACRDFNALLRQPVGTEAGDETLPTTLKELAQKELTWEGLDESELVAIRPLLFGSGGLLQLSQRRSQDKDPVQTACRRHALEVCSRFLEPQGYNRMTLLEDHFEGIVSGCMHVFRFDVMTNPAEASLQLLLSVLEVPGCPQPPLGLGQELLKELKVRHSKLGSGQTARLMRVLAAIADRMDSSEPDGEAFVVELHRRLLGTVDREVSAAKPGLELIAGALSALDVFLRRHAALLTHEETRKLYDTVCVIALTADSGATRLAPRRAALALLHGHARLFHEFSVADVLQEIDAKGKPSSADAAESHGSGLLDKLLEVKDASQADIAAQGRDTLDSVLRALSQAVITVVDLERSSVPALERAADAADVGCKRELGEGEGQAISHRLAQEARVVRAWYPRFQAMVVKAVTAEKHFAVSLDALIGARSLGALAPAVALLDGAGVALDILDSILDAAEAAVSASSKSPIPETEGIEAAGPTKVAGAMREYAEALAHTIPVVRQRLTEIQVARVLAVGAHLLKGFSVAFTKYRPAFARACVALLSALNEPHQPVKGGEDNSALLQAEQGSGSGIAGGNGAYEAFVTQGIILMVTEEPSLQALWELVFQHLEQAGMSEAEQQLVDSIIVSVLNLARQGVDHYLRLQHQEEVGVRSMADQGINKRGLSLALGTLIPQATAPSQDGRRATADSGQDIALQMAYMSQQVVETTDFLQRIASFLERAFGGAGARAHLLRPWTKAVISAVADFTFSCRAVTSPPPGIFQLLRVTLASCSQAALGQDAAATSAHLDEDLRKSLPVLLESITGAVEGYQGVIAIEALEALLSVRPEWVQQQDWNPVFRRALHEGLHDFNLAQHALNALERWRDSGMALDWTKLLPNLAAYLHSSSNPQESRPGVRRTAAELRASRAMPEHKAKDRQAFVRRLLRFIGSLGGDCHALIAEEHPPEVLQRPAAALSLRVPLALGSFVVELEPAFLLPHFARLLQQGQRRCVRLAAGEALHALLRLVIGSDTVIATETVVEGREAPTDFADALRNPLLPMALKAAADEDATLGQLFRSVLTQLVNWVVRCPPTATLTALRDALLEAMSDAHSPSLRWTASKYYAELVHGLWVKADESGGKVARRMLQYLLAAASHVDRWKQLGALQSLSWYSLSWEQDAAAIQAAAECMKVVVLCLQTSHLDGHEGLPTEAAALQLGSRLLHPLTQVRADGLRWPPELMLHLWRGAGLLEPTARGFCREALQRLHAHFGATVMPSAEQAATTARAATREPVNWDTLILLADAGRCTSTEPTAAARTLELLTARLDTGLWLATPDGGPQMLKTAGFSAIASEDEELARRGMEERTLLVPWSSSGGIDSDALQSALSRFPPRKHDQVDAARTRALVAMVAHAKLGPRVPSQRVVQLLLTLILQPAALLVCSAQSWGTLAARRYVVRCAAQAVRRAHPGLEYGPTASLRDAARVWLQVNPLADIARCTGQETDCGAFEVLFRQWPEYRRGDHLGIAERMLTFVEGLEALQQEVTGHLWQVFFSGWQGGLEAMLKDWQQSVYWHAQKRSAASAQLLTQCMVRFLLIVVAPVSGSSGSGLPSGQKDSDKVTRLALTALLSLPRPPKEALPHLLDFFAKHAALVFQLSLPWGVKGKKTLLNWLCDFAAFASEGTSPISKHDIIEDKEVGTTSSLSPMLRGSVLGEASLHGRAEPTEGKLNTQARHAEKFVQVLLELPAWHEWAVSDAAHGGACEGDAKAEPPPSKRARTSKAATAVARVRQVDSDRSGLYQLATLLHTSLGVEPVLKALSVGNAKFCRFLLEVLAAVLNSSQSSPRTKARFLVAVPPLVLRYEARTAVEKSSSDLLTSTIPAPLSETGEAVEAQVRNMVLTSFPLSSKEYTRDSEEYATYVVLLDGLFRAMELSAPSMRLLPALFGTLREHNHREAPRLRGFVYRFIRQVLGNPAGVRSAAAVSLKAALTLFFKEDLDHRDVGNVRFAIAEKFVLPLLWEMTGTAAGCIEAWLSHWPQLLARADPIQTLGAIPLGDARALALKLQEMGCVYGAIEILFVRTPPEVLRERIIPRLPPNASGQQSSPSRDLILTAKRALERPPGWERLDAVALRRCHLRIYAAYSAAVCATQAKQDLYGAFLFKDELWIDDLLTEPWGSRPVSLAGLGPNTSLPTFARPGYSFSFLSTSSISRRGSGVRSAMETSSGDATLLGAGLWAPSLAGGSSILGTFAMPGGGPQASLQASVIQRAAMSRAAGSLSATLPEVHRRRLAATMAAATQGGLGGNRARDGSPVEVQEDLYADLPFGDIDAAANKLQAALASRRPWRGAEEEGVEEEEATRGAVSELLWRTEWLEYDSILFPDGPAEDCALALLLILLRTADVMAVRFGGNSSHTPGWLSPLLSAAERPTSNFRLRLLVLRLLVLRAELIRHQLYGCNPRLFRFVVGTMLDPRFGAEKRFHYHFRDALQRLVVPEFGLEEEGNASDLTVQASCAPAGECAYDAERLLHHLQMLAPHNATYWQRTHLALVRLFITHFSMPGARISVEPDTDRLVQQLRATSQVAVVLQQSALRQLALFLEYSTFNPFKEGAEGSAVTEHLRIGLLSCAGAKDMQVAAYASGVVGLLAKWYPVQGSALIEECCSQMDAAKEKAHDKNEALRVALCTEQLLLQCPWALCDIAAARASGSSGSSPKRRIFTKMISLLTVAPAAVLRPLLAAFRVLCHDCVEDPAAANAVAAADMSPSSSVVRRRPPPPPRREDDGMRQARRACLDEFLLAMRTGEVWSRGLLSKDTATQQVTAGLVRTVASVLDDETLLGCVGLMLEAEAQLQGRSLPDKVSQSHQAFLEELMSVCIAVCDRRPDVARGEVAEGVVSFMIKASVSENEALHSKALEYWDAKLSGEAPLRLSQLCGQLGEVDVEPVFIPVALQFLVALARHSAEFRRKLVRKPLAECEFRPMRIDASVQHAPTFQLGATWGSLFQSTLSQTLGTRPQPVRRGEDPTRSKDGAASVAASLAEDAIPMQLKAAKRRRVAAAPGSASGKSQSRPAVGLPSGLLRHSDADAKHNAIVATERQTKAALKSLEKRSHGEEGDDATKLIRGYRIGDFPDVEVTVEDIVEPLARIAREDLAFGEEFLLALWSGISIGANVEHLQRALCALLERSKGDAFMAHFLHSLIMRCGRACGAALPLPALQRTLGASLLSGVQALEELLPCENLDSAATPTTDGGRHRDVLSMLYSACAALGEKPSSSAVVSQLGSIGAFTSRHSEPALTALREGRVSEAEKLLMRVLSQEEAALPAWELRMASVTRMNALEDLLSWDHLQVAIQEGVGGGSALDDTALDSRSLRATLGQHVMPLEGDMRSTSLDAKIEDASSHHAGKVASARSAMLLATYAAARGKWDDARHLTLQGYDLFAVGWRQTPLLAVRAQHELLSSLPLLRAVESFAEVPVKSAEAANMRPLSIQHDSFPAWVDSALTKIVIARTCGEKQLEAGAYAELGRRCRQVGNLIAAGDMMKRCLKSRVRQDHQFYEDVFDLKLAQKEQPCEKLCSLVRTEAAKHKDPQSALHYHLILTKVAVAGWERNELNHSVAWAAFRSAKGLAEECGALEQSRTCAKMAAFVDAVLRQVEQVASQGLPDMDHELVASLIECVTRVLQLGDHGVLRQGDAFHQAHERLPRVFELLAMFPSCCEPFEKHAVSIPAWPFLRWLPQALAHLPKVPVLMGPLLAVAREFPQALFWPLQLAAHEDVVGNRSQVFQPLWNELKRCRAPMQTALTLTRSLEFLTHPDARLASHLRKFKEALSRGTHASAKDRWRALWSKVIDIDKNIAGPVHVNFAQRLRQGLHEASRKFGLSVESSELSDTDSLTAKREAWQKFFAAVEGPKGLLEVLRRVAPGPGSRVQLEVFSSWLATFDARTGWLGSIEEQLEVPGQYAGLQRPDSRAHARVLRFAPQVLVMASKQRPKRLIMLGSDEHEHWFLVKGGEDVRLDERVEQLFNAVNGFLAAEAVVGLRLRTYAVVPLLPDLGILEWVRETKPLKALVMEMAKAKEMSEVEAHKLRIEWARRFGQPIAARYAKIFAVPRADVVVAFRRCTAALPASATLRAFLWRQALGPEAFWHMRQRLAASLAATSCASYLLGIGDRHLDNYLLCLQTAEVVPIDFGYSFGIGALLPVPELMPFRLTGFLVSALQPLAGSGAHGAFRDGLTAALARCRENRGLLLDMCAIFIHEPLIDWTAESRRRGDTDVDFLPKRRLRFVGERLLGRHPAAVLREELRDNPHGWVREQMRGEDGIEAVVAGLHDDRRAAQYRSTGASGSLSPAEQVDCLIRQATDPNVLGRAYEGWAPEI